MAIFVGKVGMTYGGIVPESFIFGRLSPFAKVFLVN